ncbi:hypothetical protein [Gynurincola endophyticus]|uniref:hypothetical protein n=1 Tax=Gynurincola endophyticus TaxID=2479004 RepID=UPI000F8D4502|nr:hypothetical protein [Gynurincola endophyticus]
MSNKKKYPLTLSTEIAEIRALEDDKIKFVLPGKNILCAKDRDVNSKFHFTVHKYQTMNDGTIQVFVSKKPTSKDEVGTEKKWIYLDQFKQAFLSWKSIIEAYNSLNNIFEESEHIQYIDSESKRKLDYALEIIDKALDNKKTEENKSAIDSIKKDISSLREKLDTENKKSITSKLESILNKIKKIGIKFSKEFLSEAQKEVIKRIIKGGIDLGKEFISDLI